MINCVNFTVRFEIQKKGFGYSSSYVFIETPDNLPWLLISSGLLLWCIFRALLIVKPLIYSFFGLNTFGISFLLVEKLSQEFVFLLILSFLFFIVILFALACIGVWLLILLFLILLLWLLGCWWRWSLLLIWWMVRRISRCLLLLLLLSRNKLEDSEPACHLF